MEISEKVVELSEKPVKRMEQLTDVCVCTYVPVEYIIDCYVGIVGVVQFIEILSLS